MKSKKPIAGSISFILSIVIGTAFISFAALSIMGMKYDSTAGVLKFIGIYILFDAVLSGVFYFIPKAMEGAGLIKDSRHVAVYLLNGFATLLTICLLDKYVEAVTIPLYGKIVFAFGSGLVEMIMDRKGVEEV